MKYLSEVQIDRAALQHNTRSLTLPHTETFAVIKANAYGHGLDVAVECLDGNVDGFAVDDIEELVAVRAITSKPTLVLGYVPCDHVEEAVRLDGELAIYDVRRLQGVADAGALLGKRPKIHLKIDALLGRQGLLPEEIPDFLAKLRNFPQIELVAAYSHFGNIEDTTDLSHAHDQTTAFAEALEVIKQSGWPNIARHESATSAVMVHESPHVGNRLVRLGVGIYSLYPSAPLSRTHQALNLQPAMRWVSHLAQVKRLPAKHPVGYGLTYVTSRETPIGIVPQGYSDGYDRGLSNCGEVLVHGVRCPVLGRIAMNMFAIDLTLAPQAQQEDEVVLLGSQGEDAITAEEIAQKIGTIHYEVVARISPLLPRTVV
ncbi:MAG: alanine racemase [Fimbriimonadaceae bacterium]|nr:alanine racemase [Fimbriimonadaceae bacterium]